MYKEKNYDSALTYLDKVEQNDKNYQSAQKIIFEINNILTQNEIENAIQDSIAKIEKFRLDSIAKIEKYRLDSIAKVERTKRELDGYKAKINGEIEVINNFNGGKYRGEANLIELEIFLFEDWYKLVRETETHYDKEVKELGKILKRKLINLQKSEFPKLRKNYADILHKKLWLEDIEVKAHGKDYTTLEFVGGTFASNRNKQETQKTLGFLIDLLRFKRVVYKWYKYDNGA